jgi:ferredoxin-type protein NapF
MIKNNSRRELFKRVRNPFAFFVYPPYYKDKLKFSECLECETKDCLLVCEEKIIDIENGFPIIKFGKSGCTFCDECANACPKDVLSLEDKKETLNCEFIININSCIAWNQTICFSCQDVCEVRAINFKGVFNPIIDKEKCTSCGFCLSVCPANSVEIVRES